MTSRSYKPTIVTIKHRQHAHPFKEGVEKVAIHSDGGWPTFRAIDEALSEFLVYRKKGSFLPLYVKDEGDYTLSLALVKPHLLAEEEYKNIYSSGIRLRALNEWAYASSLMENAIIYTFRFNDGTRFKIHRNKHLKGSEGSSELKARLSFAMGSIRAEWPEYEMTKDVKPNSYIVTSTYPSYLDVSNRDITHISPQITKVMGANNAERLLLERSNIRLSLDRDPYPFEAYDEEMDSILFDSFGLSETEKDKLKDVFSRDYEMGAERIRQDDTHISYGNVKILKTAVVNELLSRLWILPSDVMSMFGRYLSINKDSDSQYTMTAKPYATMLYDAYDVRYEGFSGPFNNRHAIFSSMFFDTDHLFGSVGPFSADHIVRYSAHNASINPPFTSYFYKLVREETEKAFATESIRKDMLVFVKVPNWNEEDTIDWLKNVNNDNAYHVAHRVIPNGQYYFERLNGRNLLRLTGGLLFAVLSPIGHNHPTFNDAEMDKLVEYFRQTTPPEVTNAIIDPRMYIDKYLLMKLVKEGTDVVKLVESGDAITNMNKKELKDEITMVMRQITVTDLE